MNHFHHRRRHREVKCWFLWFKSPKCFRQTSLCTLNKALHLRVWEANVKSYACRGQDTEWEMLSQKYYRHKLFLAKRLSKFHINSTEH